MFELVPEEQHQRNGQDEAGDAQNHLAEEARGWRVLLGGKLGRHPQLGKELEGIHSTAEVLALVERCLDLYFTHNRAGERLGTILERTGYP